MAEVGSDRNGPEKIPGRFVFMGGLLPLFSLFAGLSLQKD